MENQERRDVRAQNGRRRRRWSIDSPSTINPPKAFPLFALWPLSPRKQPPYSGRYAAPTGRPPGGAGIAEVGFFLSVGSLGFAGRPPGGAGSAEVGCFQWALSTGRPPGGAGIAEVVFFCSGLSRICLGFFLSGLIRFFLSCLRVFSDWIGCVSAFTGFLLGINRVLTRFLSGFARCSLVVLPGFTGFLPGFQRLLSCYSVLLDWTRFFGFPLSFFCGFSLVDGARFA